MSSSKWVLIVRYVRSVLPLADDVIYVRVGKDDSLRVCRRCSPKMGCRETPRRGNLCHERTRKTNYRSLAPATKTTFSPPVR